MAVLEFNWECPAIFEPVFDYTGRYILLSGGRGSGKSWFLVHLLLEELTREYHDLLCIREFGSRLDDSSHKLFKSAIKKYNLPWTVYRTKIVCNISGSQIVFIGVNDTTVDSVRSYEGFDRIYFEEAQSLTTYAFKILNPTIRKADSKLYFTYNPLKENDVASYIKNTYKDNYLYIHSTYKDNPFISDAIKKDAESIKQNNPDDYDEIYLGLLPKHDNSKVVKYYTEENEIACRYLESQDLHITMDFNIGSQAWFCLHKDTKSYYYFDQFCFQNIDTGRMIQSVLNKYKHPGTIVINGDASGNARKTSAVSGTDYDLIVNCLHLNGYLPDNIVNRRNGYKKLYRLDVKSSNGSRKNRYYSWNYKILNPLTGERNIYINPNTCPIAIKTMKMLELVQGTEDFKKFSTSDIKEDSDLIFLEHAFDSMSYAVNYYDGIESGTFDKPSNNNIVEDWKKQR